MSHQRQIIRNKVKAILIAGNTAAAGRVFASRRLPLRDLELPALAIYSGEETIDADSALTSPRELTRRGTIAIELCVAAGAITDPAVETVDDVIDDLAEEVEAVMDADRSLDHEATDCILQGASEIEIAEQGNRTVAVMVMTYAVTYRTMAPATTEAADDFNTASVEHNVTGVDHDDIDPERPDTVHDLAEIQP